jgi:hypothetical protein
MTVPPRTRDLVFDSAALILRVWREWAARRSLAGTRPATGVSRKAGR